MLPESGHIGSEITRGGFIGYISLRLFMGKVTLGKHSRGNPCRNSGYKIRNNLMGKSGFRGLLSPSNSGSRNDLKEA